VFIVVVMSEIVAKVTNALQFLYSDNIKRVIIPIRLTSVTSERSDIMLHDANKNFKSSNLIFPIGTLDEVSGLGSGSLSLSSLNIPFAFSINDSRADWRIARSASVLELSER